MLEEYNFLSLSNNVIIENSLKNQAHPFENLLNPDINVNLNNIIYIF